MTTTGEWGDARLADAYAAMTAARPTPADLQGETLTALRAAARIGRRPQASGLARLLPAASWFGAMAVALLLVVAFGGLLPGVTAPSAKSPESPDRSSAPSTSGPTATTSATPTLLGMPVISVAELIARRTTNEPPSPDEVAVRGWMVRSNVVFDCALPDIQPHPLVPRCLAPTFLMEQPERPTDLTTDGPSVNPLLGLDGHVEVDIGHQNPVEVIAIGHLGDHRWTTCPPDEQDACRRVFVADRIVEANASSEALPAPWRSPQSSASEPAVDHKEVVAWLEAAFGEITVVSLGLAVHGVLGEIEPAVNQRDDIDAVTQLRPVWVVRALVAQGQEPTVAKTFLIPDLSVGPGPGTIWEASESGVATVRRIGTGLGWPPVGATMVDTPIGRGPPPFRVAVVDETGHMVEARAPTRRESAIRDLATRTVWADDLPDGRVLVQWGGSMCDDSLTLMISASHAAAPSLLTVDGRRGSACRSMLVSNAIVLRFDPAVRAEDLAGRYLIGE